MECYAATRESGDKMESQSGRSSLKVKRRRKMTKSV